MSYFEKKHCRSVLAGCISAVLLAVCTTTQAFAAEPYMMLHSPVPEIRDTAGSGSRQNGLYVGLNNKGDLVIQHGLKSVTLAYSAAEFSSRHHASINPESIQEPLPPTGGITLAFTLAFN